MSSVGYVRPLLEWPSTPYACKRLIKAQWAIDGKCESALPYDRFRLCCDQPQDCLLCGLFFTR